MCIRDSIYCFGKTYYSESNACSTYLPTESVLTDVSERNLTPADGLQLQQNQRLDAIQSLEWTPFSPTSNRDLAAQSPFITAFTVFAFESVSIFAYTAVADAGYRRLRHLNFDYCQARDIYSFSEDNTGASNSEVDLEVASPVC